MDDSWIKVFSTSLPWQAEMAKQVLEENGIEAVVINQQDSSFFLVRPWFTLRENGRIKQKNC